MGLIPILEAFVFASTLSMDAFVASFAYGSDKIKIPMLSIQIINVICSSILGLSFLVGSFIKPYIPDRLTIIICFIILFILGIVKMLDSLTKSIIRKYNDLNKEIRFSMFNFKFILNLYANPEDANIDSSKIISPVEAAYLAIALSLDGLVVGLGAALGNVDGLAVFLSSLITNALAIMLGCYVGNKIAGKMPFNISWLGGFVLIILAFSKIL